jgi:hypothetical protein
VAKRKGRPRGRPQNENKEALFHEICDKIASGKSLVEVIASNKKYPSFRTFYNWLDDPKNTNFLQTYDQARLNQIQSQDQEIKNEAEKQPNTYLDQQGNIRIDSGYVAYQRLKIDTLKWLSERGTATLKIRSNEPPEAQTINFNFLPKPD